MTRLVVVGASLAGLRAVEALRRKGFDGDLTLVGAEPHLPYDRPPLSKEILRGDWTPDRTAFRGDVLDDRSAYAELGLDLRLGRSATALDVVGGAIELDLVERLSFDGLVIATGASARTLPDTPDLAGIFTLRSLEDGLVLRDALQSGTPRVVVIGGGFIGSEVAASARSLGLDVTILEALPVPLSRVLGLEMGAACTALHHDHGVDVRVGVVVDGFVGDGRVEGVRLADGEIVPADVVVVGIGAVPATGWLESSSLTLRDGVVCDETLAAAPGIVAAGDVARWPNRKLAGEEMRVEHWTNAVEQGVHAAERLLHHLDPSPTDAPPVFETVPYVWSDQYDAKILYVGRSRPDDPVEVVSGSVEDRRFLALYRRGERLVGALSMNIPRLLMGARRALDEGLSYDEARDRLAG